MEISYNYNEWNNRINNKLLMLSYKQDTLNIKI